MGILSHTPKERVADNTFPEVPHDTHWVHQSGWTRSGIGLGMIWSNLWIPTLGEIMTVLTGYLVPLRYIPPIKRPIQLKNTLNLDTVLDWSKSVQASSVEVQKKWGLVRSRSKNYSDWIGLDLDGPGPDWSKAGLVESLITHQRKSS
jgi:hypothetical protein